MSYFYYRRKVKPPLKKEFDNQNFYEVNVPEEPEFTEITDYSPGRVRLVVFIGLCLGLLLTVFLIFSVPTLREWGLALMPNTDLPQKYQQSLTGDLKKNLPRLQKQVADFQKKYNKLVPSEFYFIINTSDNLFTLMKGNVKQREGVCSTGSYVLLKALDNRQWIFKTPRGMFRILNKIESPVWRMPDWAFIEEGKPVPAQDASERYDPGAMGEFAMALGHGYLIHGTLYQRMLGMPVTHGCIRLGDEDLRVVYKNLHVGSKVYIY